MQHKQLRQLLVGLGNLDWLSRWLEKEKVEQNGMACKMVVLNRRTRLMDRVQVINKEEKKPTGNHSVAPQLSID